MHSIMKNHKTALILLTVAALGFATGGCSLFHHHQPKSSWKIINEGDKNPFIKETPETEIDNSTHKVEVETGPVAPQ
jgi:hypothetical protein